VTLTGAIALIAAACGGGGHAPDKTDTRPVVAVQLGTALEEEWATGSEVTAGVLPLYRATPGTVLMGRVDRVMVEEGDRVRKGQTLAHIESRDVAAKLAQARAGVAAARAMEKNAKSMVDRMARLHSRKAASDKDLEDAEAGYEAAQANLEAAEEAVKVAEVYVDYSEVTAPFSGWVVEKRVEVGDMASPGMPLFVIDDISKVKIEAQVPESTASRLAIGDPVEIEFQGDYFRGELSEMLPAADPRSRTFTVRALLDNPDGRLRPGMFARLRLDGEARPTVAVPTSAIVHKGPLTGVFVAVGLDSERATAGLRWITLGRTRDGSVEVLTGLAAGERYVVEPTSQLRDGQPIEVR
jgi:RND family efflux transporter MFP subunit